MIDWGDELPAGDLRRALDFVVTIDKMKAIVRRTLTYDGSHYENDAEHSWHLAMMAIALERYAARPVNLGRVLKMVLVHDLVEVYAGDTFAFDVSATIGQKAREDAAADKIFAMIPEGAELRAFWEEFDEGTTADAAFATALDRVQPFLSNRMNEGHTWRMGNVDRAAVYRRIEPVREALPALWDMVCGMIDDGVQKGYIRE